VHRFSVAVHLAEILRHVLVTVRIAYYDVVQTENASVLLYIAVCVN